MAGPVLALAVLAAPALAALQSNPDYELPGQSSLWASTQQQEIFWGVALLADVVSLLAFVALLREHSRNSMMREMTVESFAPM